MLTRFDDSSIRNMITGNSCSMMRLTGWTTRVMMTAVCIRNDFIREVKRVRRWNGSSHGCRPRVTKDILKESHDIKDADETEQEKEDEGKCDAQNEDQFLYRDIQRTQIHFIRSSVGGWRVRKRWKCHDLDLHHFFCHLLLPLDLFNMYQLSKSIVWFNFIIS